MALQSQSAVASSHKEPLRLALTISGAVSLGAYEGGALAALLIAVQHGSAGDTPWLRIDAMGGASAGAITALLAARTLHAGLDPIEVMERSWVTESSMSALLGDGPEAPLSIERLQKAAVELLQGRTTAPRQMVPIKVDIALASLRGLAYRISRLREIDGEVTEVEPIESHTNLDWGRFTFEPNNTEQDYLNPTDASPLDFALASAANAFGFPPKYLDRTKQDYDKEQLAKGRIVNFPDSGGMWYTDGGTIDNEPLGRVLDLANDIDVDASGCRRLHLLIHPHPTSPPPSKDTKLSLLGERPHWLPTAVGAFNLKGSQGIYDDLRRLEKTNSRLIWKNELATTLRALLQDKAGSHEMQELLRRIQEQKAALQQTVQAKAAAPVSTDHPDPLGRLLEIVTGLSGKAVVMIDTISPELVRRTLPGPPTTESLLAGEFMLHFGGFLDVELRKSDFALGYLCTLRWLEDNLPQYIDEGVAATALAKVREHEDRFVTEFANGRLGGTDMATLPEDGRRALKSTFRRIADVSLSDLTPTVRKGRIGRIVWPVVRPILRRLIPFGIARLIPRPKGTTGKNA